MIRCDPNNRRPQLVPHLKRFLCVCFRAMVLMGFSVQSTASRCIKSFTSQLVLNPGATYVHDIQLWGTLAFFVTRGRSGSILPSQMNECDIKSAISHYQSVSNYVSSRPFFLVGEEKTKIISHISSKVSTVWPRVKRFTDREKGQDIIRENFLYMKYKKKTCNYWMWYAQHARKRRLPQRLLCLCWTKSRARPFILDVCETHNGRDVPHKHAECNGTEWAGASHSFERKTLSLRHHKSTSLMMSQRTYVRHSEVKQRRNWPSGKQAVW